MSGLPHWSGEEVVKETESKMGKKFIPTNLCPTMGMDDVSSHDPTKEYSAAAISEDGASDGGPGEKTVRPHGRDNAKASNHGSKKEPEDCHDYNVPSAENRSIKE